MSSRPALVSPPPAALLRHPHPHRRRVYFRPTCAVGPSSRAVAHRGATTTTASGRLQHPRLVAAQAQSPHPLAAAGAVPRDAATGLSILMVVLASVMTFSVSLIILSFTAHKALKRVETAADKLAKVVEEEVPGTLRSLTLSFLEISDLTSQLQKLRKRLTISRFGEKRSTSASSWTGPT